MTLYQVTAFFKVKGTLAQTPRADLAQRSKVHPEISALSSHRNLASASRTVSTLIHVEQALILRRRSVRPWRVRAVLRVEHFPFASHSM